MIQLLNYSKDHLFIFSICFIMVTVDPQPTLGTLGERQEYTLHGTLVHHKAPCPHTDVAI